jgi:RecA-family ATPase
MSANNHKTKSRFDEIDWDALEAEQVGSSKPPFDNWQIDNLNELSLNKIDYSKNLLGNRWLGRSQLALVVASSGVCKSVGGIQMQAGWALGKPVFGIQPTGPLKIAMLQAEDDKNDLTAMATGVVEEMGLTPSERNLLAGNTIILSGGDRIGDTFVNQLDDWIGRYNLTHDTQIDIVIVNPAFAYIEGEVDKPEAIRNFLRWGLMLIAKKHNLGVIVIHHTPKSNNRNTSEYKTHDWMYSGHGSAEWTNASRVVLTIEQTKDPALFRFILAKRGGYSGWVKNENGVYERFFKHDSKGKLVWHEATPQEVDELTSKADELTPEDVKMVLLKNPNGVSEKKIYQCLSKEENLRIRGGKDALKVLLEDLVDSGEVIQEKKPSPKAGRPSLIYKLARKADD